VSLAVPPGVLELVEPARVARRADDLLRPLDELPVRLLAVAPRLVGLVLRVVAGSRVVHEKSATIARWPTMTRCGRCSARSRAATTPGRR
jgi:hypothetical protein